MTLHTKSGNSTLIQQILAGHETRFEFDFRRANFFTEDDQGGEYEDFRDQANRLVDMLDVAVPVVAKLKVSPCSTEFEKYYLRRNPDFLISITLCGITIIHVNNTHSNINF